MFSFCLIAGVFIGTDEDSLEGKSMDRLLFHGIKCTDSLEELLFTAYFNSFSESASLTDSLLTLFSLISDTFLRLEILD